MRVVQVRRFGGPEVLVPGEAPNPVAGPGQVVVAVSVAGVTFVETQIRRGVDKWHDRPELPYVPGGTVAGRVRSVGEGVDPGWEGRGVLADIGESGGLAEQAVAEVGALIPVPEKLELSAAARRADQAGQASRHRVGLVPVGGGRSRPARLPRRHPWAATAIV